MTAQLDDVLADIDIANTADPKRLGDHPLARAQGQLASIWLDQLDPEAPIPVRIAARAHHLKRWEIARSDYPEGRSGYLRWRRDNKQHQANSAADILTNHGYTGETINRVGELLLRKALATDPDTQLLEDAACLVFIQTQFDEMVRRLGEEQMVDVVAKTLRKMSSSAIQLAGSIELSDSATAVLARAVATGDGESD